MHNKGKVWNQKENIENENTECQQVTIEVNTSKALLNFVINNVPYVLSILYKTFLKKHTLNISV